MAVEWGACGECEGFMISAPDGVGGNPVSSSTSKLRVTDERNLQFLYCIASYMIAPYTIVSDIDYMLRHVKPHICLEESACNDLFQRDQK